MESCGGLAALRLLQPFPVRHRGYGLEWRKRLPCRVRGVRHYGGDGMSDAHVVPCDAILCKRDAEYFQESANGGSFFCYYHYIGGRPRFPASDHAWKREGELCVAE